MSIFEYLMVMVSIILGLSITQVLRGLSKIARSPRRSVAVTLYGVFLFALHVQTWWALWDLSDVPEWNFVFFLLLISIPSVLDNSRPVGNAHFPGYSDHASLPNRAAVDPEPDHRGHIPAGPAHAKLDCRQHSVPAISRAAHLPPAAWARVNPRARWFDGS